MTSSLLRGNIILQMDVSEKLSEDRHCLPNINELGELLLEVVFRLHLFSTFVVQSYHSPLSGMCSSRQYPHTPPNPTEGIGISCWVGASLRPKH